MSEDEITLEEKVSLLACMDAQNPDDYDHQFFDLLCNCQAPLMTEINDRVRRAQMKFITQEWEVWKRNCTDMGIGEDSGVQSAMHIMLLIGYELGRKLKRPLTTKPGSPR